MGLTPRPTRGIVREMTPHYPIRRTVPLMLAGACGVLMAFGWDALGVVCAVGAVYAVNDLVERVRCEHASHATTDEAQP